MEQVRLESNNNSRINPQLFSLWMGMASIVMLFGALTSAYIVKQGAGNWLDFKVPSVFYISTAIIISSSVSLHLARNAYRAGKEQNFKFLVLTTLVLGLA
ncbi:MAG TPA: cytochrome oxidase subunit III, partial [Saprospiraceae bacterium]|nr:cytochrome oxidase subunit III [Saprospiraceae bacterium]